MSDAAFYIHNNFKYGQPPEKIRHIDNSERVQRVSKSKVGRIVFY